MTLCSRARTPLMMLVRPAAPSECPTFGLTYWSRPRQLATYLGMNMNQECPMVVRSKTLTAPILTPP